MGSWLDECLGSVSHIELPGCLLLSDLSPWIAWRLVRGSGVTVRAARLPRITFVTFSAGWIDGGDVLGTTTAAKLGYPADWRRRWNSSTDADTRPLNGWVVYPGGYLHRTIDVDEPGKWARIGTRAEH